ncbi:hypothetical protein [Mycoplasmopsis columbinasalis]|uniref:Transposase n=1 Tax=Mycoplasmopsis columbinasalis TaxID=114880 RepID=A0A449B9N6_9BACT|nr:hypothetical protein [Mycoplasmopsis columbinasalis]VEU77892.1 Uncharacterised protein [Mycoplasmopsis columbinasalis]
MSIFTFAEDHIFHAYVDEFLAKHQTTWAAYIDELTHQTLAQQPTNFKPLGNLEVKHNDTLKTNQSELWQLCRQGVEIVAKFNVLEEHFRTKGRFEDANTRTFIVRERYVRTISINGFELTYNLTMYSKPQQGKFMYYHTQALVNLKRKKYLALTLHQPLHTQPIARRKPKPGDNRLPHYVWAYAQKSKFYQTQQVNFDAYLTKFHQSATIQIDIDDAYQRVQSKGKVYNQAVRIAHITNETNEKLIFVQKLTKSTKNVNVLVRFLINQLQLKNNCKLVNLLICGDGAKFVTKIAKSLQGVRLCDLFHIRDKIVKTFAGLFSMRPALCFYHRIIAAFEARDANLLLKEITNFTNFALSNHRFSAKVRTKIQALQKYFLKNFKLIEHTFKLKPAVTPYAESAISHYFKANTKSAFCTYSWETICQKVLSTNRTINIIFL